MGEQPKQNFAINLIELEELQFFVFHEEGVG
jgi:hypothetical protein